MSAPPDVVVGEADGFVDLPVTLNAPGQNPATVNYTTLNSTALSGTTCGSGAGYVGVQGSLTFAPGQTTQTVRVDLLNCQRAVPGTFLFGLSTPGGATIARSSASITIVETAGVPGAPTGVTAVPGDHERGGQLQPAGIQRRGCDQCLHGNGEPWWRHRFRTRFPANGEWSDRRRLLHLHRDGHQFRWHGSAIQPIQRCCPGDCACGTCRTDGKVRRWQRVAVMAGAGLGRGCPGERLRRLRRDHFW